MRSMVRKLRRLSPGYCRGLATAYLYLLRAGFLIMLRRENLDHWLEVGPGIDARKPTTPAELTAIARRARWVNAAARYPLPWARCLQRSLALCFWLRGLGFSPVLKIGVRLEGASLSAHAWVEHGGLVINDSPRAVGEFAVLKSADLRLVGSGLSREGRWI